MRIGINFKRRLPGRRAGLAVLLLTIVLTVSGCDWARTTFDGIGKHVTVKRVVTDNMIWGCTLNHGTGYVRAHCVLDKVRALCQGAPQGFFSWSECVEATRHDLNEERMFYSIKNVIGEHTPDGDCLRYQIGVGPNYIAWVGTTKIGERGCE